MRTESSTHQNPPEHAYNRQGIGPLEFLTEVMHATHLPMVSRIEAARALLPYTESVPRPVTPPAYTIVIPPISYEPWADICSPWPRSTGMSSQDVSASSTTTIHGDDTKANVNLRGDTEPQDIDYSSISPEELQHLKAMAHKWGLPEPHLCSYCGHWLTVTYPDCICGDYSSRDPSRDPSKLN